MPCSLAWSSFGEANGARSAQDMRRRIARYRRAEAGDRTDFEIGCRILTQPFFLEERDWLEVPRSWSPNIVSFKTYNTEDREGLALWEAVQERMARQASPGFGEAAPRFGEPQLIRPRLGQGAFRVLVTDLYRAPLRRNARTHAAGPGSCPYSPLRRRWASRSEQWSAPAP
jgi:putative restriction endonuclease